MPFVWNVQPYQTLKELRDNYLNFVITATRKDARSLAVEAEEWMRQNAPWKDRPDDQRTAHEQREGHAREGLRVTVIGGKEEEEEDKRQLGIAKKDDAKLLKELNESRRDKYLATLTGVQQRVKAGEITGIKDLGFSERMGIYRLGKRMTKLPKSRSNVARVEKLQAQRFPLVQVNFRQNPRLRYTIFLELGMGGRYAIIGPALDYWGPKFMLNVQRIANLKQYQSVNLRGEAVDIQEIIDQSGRLEQAAEGYEFVSSYGQPYRPHTLEFQRESVQRAKGTRSRKKRRGDNRRKYER